jgi:hypothetical protein
MPYSTPSSFIIGFHACDAAEARRAVLRKQHLQPSNTAYDWLGAGIYFWEDNPKRAMEWAMRLKARGRIRKPAIVGAIIDPGLCLNLLDPPDLEMVQEAYRELLATSAIAGKSMARDDAVKGDQALLLSSLGCEAINTVHRKRVAQSLEPYDTIRAAFVDGGPPRDSASFSEATPVQICVRTLRCIQGYFLPD